MNKNKHELDRREFLTRTMPVCAMACLGLGNVSILSAMANQDQDQENKHKFDTDWDQVLTQRQLVSLQYRNLIQFIRVLQTQMDDKELIEYLKHFSAKAGIQVGERQLAAASDNSFQSFVSVFRPPNYKNTLTHEIVQDTEKVFELKVTECLWAAVFREAGLGGELGYATICNMDYHWPNAFNPDFKMERSKTLMQGDDHCNHKYIDTT
jgi:hypothetical protein